MEEASTVRAVALELVGDIETVPLGERIEGLLDDVEVTPGTLTVMTARAFGGNVEAARTRGAGVQLSYEGLRLARRLAADEVIWETEDRTDEYIELLVSEVLVSRGFYHLARTEVADTAIETVRRFARNQTIRQMPDYDPADVDSTLEIDVINMSVEAGATLTRPSLSGELRSYADDLAHELDSDPLAPPETALAGVEEELRAIATDGSAPIDRSATADGSR